MSRPTRDFALRNTGVSYPELWAERQTPAASSCKTVQGPYLNSAVTAPSATGWGQVECHRPCDPRFRLFTAVSVMGRARGPAEAINNFVRGVQFCNAKSATCSVWLRAHGSEGARGPGG